MNRYKKANEGIHAPEELKDRAINARRPARRGRPLWWGAAAAVLAVAILAGAVLWPGGRPASQPGASLTIHPLTIAQAVYPEAVPFPDYADYVDDGGHEDYDAYFSAMSAWQKAERERQALPVNNDSMADYYAATMEEFLGDSGGENAVYSPLNLYLALAMLAELTDGNSRQQILDLLDAADMDTLPTLAHGLWNANYRDDGMVTSILASSLWLNKDVSFVQDTMERLAEVYYASSYQGEMGSQELNQALQDWLNDQTGGLLEEYAGQIQLEPETVLALAATLCFRVKWGQEFNPARNTQEDFDTPQGAVTAEFMHGATQTYYWGEQFSATRKGFEGGGEMWLILPDEGVSVDDLLDDPEAMEFFLTREDWTNQAYLQVNLSLPKFDVSAQTDLTQGLQNLGVTDVFDPAVSDYSPMTTQGEGIYLSQAVHAARVVVDEEGVEAAAFTVMAPGSGAPSEDEVDFVLDRPFLFLITSDTDQILFAGVVNNPND